MTSPKEQWRQQISDYDILFIKGGWWLVDKSNSLYHLSIKRTEGKGRGGRIHPPTHDYEGQKYPITNRVNTEKGLHHFLMTLRVFNIEKELHHFLETLKSFNFEKWHNHILMTLKVFQNSYSVECWWTAISEGRLSYHIYD